MTDKKSGGGEAETPIYQMPVSFGPAPGPRQLPPPGSGYVQHPKRVRRHGTRFLSDAAQLDRLLPPQLTLRGEPVVTVEFSELSDIEWLAGRGYNLLSVRLPVSFRGKEKVDGQHLAVVWENLTEPIITGREQLGWPKIYADLPPPRMIDGRSYSEAWWDGFRFFEMEVAAERPLEGEALKSYLAAAAKEQGTIVHKFVPRTGKPWREADADYLTLGPLPNEDNAGVDPAAMDLSVRVGDGSCYFHEATWQQMPTQFHIVKALAALPIVEKRGAWIVEVNDSSRWRDQCILR